MDVNTMRSVTKFFTIAILDDEKADYIAATGMRSGRGLTEWAVEKRVAS
jgi:hypothetical protein